MVGVRIGNFPCKGSAGVRYQDGRRRFPKEGWPDASWLASVRVCKGGTSYFLRHLENTAAINLSLFRPFVRLNPMQRSCTCRPRTLPTRSSRQSRTRLASLCASRRAFPRRTKSEYVVSSFSSYLVPTAGAYTTIGRECPEKSVQVPSRRSKLPGHHQSSGMQDGHPTWSHPQTWPDRCVILVPDQAPPCFDIERQVSFPAPGP